MGNPASVKRKATEKRRKRFEDRLGPGAYLPREERERVNAALKEVAAREEKERAGRVAKAKAAAEAKRAEKKKAKSQPKPPAAKPAEGK